MHSSIEQLYVVSAPSGGGKTSLTRELVKRHPKDFEISVSLTTREPRAGEANGVDYHYVSKEEFLAKQNSGRMLETAEVHGRFYGTSLDIVERIAGRNKTPILIIDVQGWISVKKIIPKAKSVFILPPNLISLWQRLEGRGTDQLESRWMRLCEARKELSYVESYDHYIVNDNFDSAYEQLEKVIVHNTDSVISKAEGVKKAKFLINEFETADWVKQLRLKFADHQKARGEA